MTNAILRLPQVKARVGLSRSTIYLAISEGTFPRPIRIGTRAVGWLEYDLEEWLRKQVQLSRKENK